MDVTTLIGIMHVKILVIAQSFLFYYVEIFKGKHGQQENLYSLQTMVS